MSGGTLPEGWVGSSLGDVLDVNSGVGFPIKFQGKNSGDYPVYKVSDISLAVTKNNGNLSTAGHYISKEEAVELKGKIFRPGSTAFAKIGEAVKLNRRAIVHSPGLADNNVMVISAVLHEMDKFIFHFMNTIDLSEQARSTTVPSIRKGDIENIRLALPSIYEQKIIAEKLDTLLAQVDSTKARLEQIPQILKRFRQAVLAAVVDGKSANTNTDERTLTTLGNIAKDIKYGTSKKCSETQGSTAVLRIPNIGPGYIINSNLKYADFDQKELATLTLKEGDLLLIRSNGSVDLVGKVAVISENDIEYLYAGYLIRVRPNKERSVPKYISYCLQSPQLRQIIENIARSTSGVNNINSKELASLEIPLPPLSEQHEIVRRVEQLFAWADTIEKQVNSALTRVNNLTQSILAKAFRGELTAQWRAENPDLISGENSAAALLEKIKAERAASGGKKNSRKKA
ncbi:TPA: restriction endonuclease subunit S [Salmonella enterica]|nr:restriction endonuclease subunit S [Salmonella enterica]